jgi:hypothetical protein
MVCQLYCSMTCPCKGSGDSAFLLSCMSRLDISLCLLSSQVGPNHTSWTAGRSPRSTNGLDLPWRILAISVNHLRLTNCIRTLQHTRRQTTMHGVSTKMTDGTNLDDDQDKESAVLLIQSNRSLCFVSPVQQRELSRWNYVPSCHWPSTNQRTVSL